MAKKKKEEQVASETKILSKIADFITTNKKLVIAAVGAVVVLVVAIVIIASAIEGSKEKQMIRIDALEQRFNEFSAMSTDDPNHYETYSNLINDLNREVGGSSYASVKSSYLMGLAYFSQKHFTPAYEAFMKAYNLNSKIYLAPLSLINAAACKESMGETDAALDLYRQAADFTDGGVKDRALFSIGRIYLQSGNTALARATFQEIVDMPTSGEYKALAINILTTL